MIKFFSILLILLSSTFVNAQRQGNIDYYLGFNLMPNHSGDLITFALVHVKDDQVVGQTPVSREKWVRYAAGEQMCPANKELKNLFIEHEVDSCWVHFDANYFEHGKKVYVGYDCYGLSNLWKLRYKKHPYEHNAVGWSEGDYNCSGRQFAFLKRFYNVGSQVSYFYGDNAFKLLKDMANEEWVDFYSEGDLTWESESEKENEDGEEEEGN